jgi:hypothetical protein
LSLLLETMRAERGDRLGTFALGPKNDRDLLF